MLQNKLVRVARILNKSSLILGKLVLVWHLGQCLGNADPIALIARLDIKPHTLLSSGRSVRLVRVLVHDAHVASRINVYPRTVDKLALRTLQPRRATPHIRVIILRAATATTTAGRTAAAARGTTEGSHFVSICV